MVEKRRIRKTSQRSNIFALALCTVFLLLSCDGTLYHSFKPVENMQWNCGDTLEFFYPGNALSDTVYGIDMAFEVRHTASYSFKYLAVQVVTATAGDSVLSVDTLSCRLYDDNGHRCGSTVGSMYQQSSDNLFIPVYSSDSVRIKVSHIMDVPQLTGVSDVGIRLSESSAHDQHQF